MTDSMPHPRLPFTRHERNRHGKWVWYFRRDNGPRIRLHGAYRSTEFMAAYHAALSGEPTPKAEPARSGTVAWLVERYKESGEFMGLAESSQYFRGQLMKQMVAGVGHIQFVRIEQKHIQQAMDARAKTPFAANNLLVALSQLFAYAVKRKLIKVNPCAGVTPFRTKSNGHHTWTVEQVEQYRAHHKVGTRARLALDLLLFTGLRISDLTRIGRQHVKNGVLSIRTQKTGVVVEIPIFPELRASIDATQTGDLAFVVGERGRPFQSPIAFARRFRTWCNEAGIPLECSAHGVRKAGATIAANKGASARQLMAMFGWSRISMAEQYTKAADKARLAAQTAELIANEFSAAPSAGAAKDTLDRLGNKAVEK